MRSFGLPFSRFAGKRFAFLIAGSSIVLLLLIMIAGNGYQAALKQQQEIRYLSELFDPATFTKSRVRWSGLGKNSGREFTSFEADEIGNQLTQAWHNMQLAFHSGNEDFLNDYFDGPALETAKRAVSSWNKNKLKGLAVLDQLAVPRFFHLDGSSLEIKSENQLNVRYRMDVKTGSVDLLHVSRDCTRQVLFLQTVGWKIHNHETDCSKQLNLMNASAADSQQAEKLIGLNYYPGNSPWNEFWPEFDASIVEEDFALMESLGANSARIFIPFDYFTDPITSEDAEKRLKHLLFLAEQYQIAIVATLFDFHNGYDPVSWPKDYAYLKSVLGILAKHSAVSLIDLKNEPDLDYALYGEEKVNAWLELMSILSKDLAPQKQVTIGWLDHKHAAKQHRLVDVVSYHEYADPEETQQRYQATKAAVEGKRVIVSEVGRTSWSLMAGLPSSNNGQADWLKMQLAALQYADGVLVWTLHDFPKSSAAQVATLPWRQTMQARFGLFDEQGNPKPSAKTFENFTASQAIRTRK